MIRARKECREISWGDYVVLRTNVPEVLALRYDWRDTSLLTLHNFGSARRKVRVKIDCPNDDVIVDVFDNRDSKKHNDGAHRIDLDGYGWGWYTRRQRRQLARSLAARPDQSDALRHRPGAQRDTSTVGSSSPILRWSRTRSTGWPSPFRRSRTRGA